MRRYIRLAILGLLFGATSTYVIQLATQGNLGKNPYSEQFDQGTSDPRVFCTYTDKIEDRRIQPGREVLNCD